MLQRIQTVYLLVSFLLLTLMIFFPLFEFNAGAYIFDPFQIKSTAEGGETLASYPIAIFLIITALSHLGTIFLFKNRPLQMRITTFLSIFLLGFYALLAFYYFVIINFEITETKAQLTLIVPLIAAVLTFMANRQIKKDENLVRSADRFR